MIPDFKLNQILSFDDKDGHPTSKIVGIDRYTFEAEDGLTRKWNSFTLVPVNDDLVIGAYARWYVVDLPEYGLSFVQLIKEDEIPEGLISEPRLTGAAFLASEGNAEMGTGKSKLWVYRHNNLEMKETYAKEIFDDGSVLFFKMTSLKGPVAVSV